MKVDTRTAKFRHDIDEASYYFCSAGCLEKFKRDPAGALYPWFGILFSPIIAGAAMFVSSVTVIGNALRLRGVRL